MEANMILFWLAFYVFGLMCQATVLGIIWEDLDEFDNVMWAISSFLWFLVIPVAGSVMLGKYIKGKYIQ